MPSAYAYVRYSSTVQSSGDSVDRQISPLKAFEKDTGVEIVETIIDEAVSSFRGDNVNKGKFKEVLSRIDRGVIRKGDYLVVESIDRITRQRVTDGVELLQSILKKGVKIHTTSDSRCYSYDDPSRDFETLMMISLIAKRANEESEIKSKRRKSAWIKAKLAAANEGKKFNAHNPPYGFHYNEDSKKFAVVENEAAEVRMIFELLKTMGVSNAIRRVNAISKRKWTNRQVALMIENKYPLGTLRSQKRDEARKKVFIEFIDGYYPTIISQTTFNEAVSAMAARKDKTYYGNTTVGSTNIFRHVIKCANCGETMLFEKQKNQKGIMYPYFNCYTRKELKGQCDQRFRFDLAFGMLLHATQVIHSKVSPGIVRYDFETNGKPEIKWKNPKPSGTFSEVVVKRLKMDSTEQLERGIGLDGFGDDFSSFLSDDKSSRDMLGSDLAGASEVLARLKEKYGNVEKSLDGYDGIIPMPIIKMLEKLEVEIEDQTSVVDRLSGELNSSVTDIKLTTFEDVLDLFRTEDGRLKLNKFFKASKLVFTFRYDKPTRSLHMWVHRNDQEVLSISRKFSLHKPLAYFGIPRLAELYEQM